MRISDWSSDVCSSDLPVLDVEDGLGIEMRLFEPAELLAMRAIGEHARGVAQHRLLDQVVRLHEQLLARIEPPALMQIGMVELARQRDDGNVVQIGRESCREKVCQYV